MTDAPVEAALDANDAVLDSAPEAAAPQGCDAQTPCSGPSSVQCCGGICADTAADPAHCGACNVACTSTQFCNGTMCNDAIIANVCANAKGTVALDQYTPDNQAGAALSDALVSSCSLPPTIAKFSQSAPGVLEPVTGRPITGVGNTFIAGGGGFGQHGVTYMESEFTGIYLSNDGTTSNIVKRSTAMNVVSTLDSALTAGHDFFYVQLTVEPVSGTLCFEAVGIYGPGTQAAGYYAAAELIPHRAKYTANWYVFEWSDTNGNSTADQGDTFTQVASGM